MKQNLYDKLIKDNNDLLRVLTALAKDLNPNLWPRLVGGCVRDCLLGIDLNDIDIATPLPPEQVMALLPEAKLIPIGINFGTVKVILNSKEFEITTLRKDVSCDGRHAVVEFTDDFKIDAERRDFTINALSYCPLKDELFDYFEGLKHLKEKKVFFIGNPELRIKEDYLRIMRFFRFSAKYSDVLDPYGYNQCIRYAHKLSEISAERINAELDKILLQSNTKYILDKMLSGQILQSILPGLNFDIEMEEQIALTCYKLGLKSTLSLKYAALLHKNNVKDLSKTLKKQKFSNNSTYAITKLLEEINSLTSVELLKEQLLIRKYKNFSTKEYAVLVGCLHSISNENVQECINTLDSFTIKKLPINGNDIENLGYKGKEIGSVMEYLEKIWITGEFIFSKEELIKKASEFRNLH